jgi:hypothetical protein
MKKIIAALSLALVGVTILLALELRSSSMPAPVSTGERAPIGEASAPPRVPPPTVDVRAQVRRAVEEKAPALKSASDVEHYLSDLESQARRNGKVTALEVEPGMQAIAQLRGELGRERAMELELAFGQKMARISAERDRRDGPQAAPDLDELARQVEHPASADAREAAIRQYLEAAQALSGDEQVRALQRLNQLAHPPQ